MPNPCLVNLSLGSYPGSTPLEAMREASKGVGVFDPVLGLISTSNVQVCPQNCRQQLDEVVIDQLKCLYPKTKFRLHANVRVLEKHIPAADLSAVRRYYPYFRRLAELSIYMKATAYTLHAGKRDNGSWNDLLNNRKRLEDLFSVTVGIEGLYPATNNKDHYWLNSWKEYQRLLEASVPFALDLSHLNIVAHAEKKQESTLVAEMLASPYCIEVHVSDNKGIKDSHLPLDKSTPVWWASLLHHKNSDAVCFYEGNLSGSNLMAV